MEIKRGNRPVLSHVGRSSGKTYETPLDAHAVEGGYIFIANYGRDSDWVKNILAAGTAALRVDGDEFARPHERDGMPADGHRPLTHGDQNHPASLVSPTAGWWREASAHPFGASN
jgi:deazaflavin-dependent oxidoreductase (nitroreductase family)